MPNPAVERRKAELRAEVRAKLKGLTTTERETDSALARRRLESCEIWRQAGSILFFAPLPEELDIWPLLALALGEGKSAALPRFVATTDKYEAALIDDPPRNHERNQVPAPQKDVAPVPCQANQIVIEMRAEHKGICLPLAA